MNKIKFILLLFTALVTRVVVNAQTATGPATLCIGTPANYFATPAGGTWSSSAPAIGSVDPFTGVGTGMSAGTCVFTYTLPTSAYATVPVTVAIPPTPGVVTGVDTVCLGGSTTFASTLGGGTWSSSSPAIAGVSSAGVVTGYSVGSTTISHTISSGGCMASGTHNITVMPAVTIWMPVSTTMCTGFMMAASASVSGGAWVSTDPTRATVSSTGVIITYAPGYTTIIYTLPSGCSASMLITVVPAPVAITGPTTVCDGHTITLTDAVPGGTWSSTTPSVAVVGSATGIVSGITTGTATIEYTAAMGCSVSTVITVLPPASITGGATVCTGSSTTLTGMPSGGVWSYTGSSISMSGGVVTGIAAGVSAVTYTSSAGCSTVTMVSVNPAPPAITGTTTVCTGSSTTLMCAVAGGIWTTSASTVATVGIATGIATGVAPGTCTITYTLPTGCYSTTVVTVTPGAAITGGGATVCTGSSTTLTGTPSGGTWSTVSSGISLSGGIVTGVSAGAAVITYSSGGCSTTTMVTVMPSPAAITGTASVCAGSSTTLMCTTTGGTWSSSVPGTGSIDAATGVATGIAAGTTTITYTLPTGCYTTVVLSVNALPGVSASATAATCGNSYAMSASGAATYLWSPASGLSCTTCSSPVTTPGATTVYTVAGTSAAGCTGTAMVTISIDRVYGHITFSSTAPSVPALKVWLIQFNPSDSSITSTDSVTSCTDAGVEYFQFDSKPAGNYLVKAKLLSAVPATSDYIPTYGASTANWYSAATIAHTAGGVDMQDISMIYGTVPAGPGFISGYVYSGAGKGTAGDIPVEGMMIYLKNTSSNVLTYTYTNASGVFTFPSLAYGSYVIYPEEQSYYTTPSDVITLSAEMPGYDVANFRQYTTTGVIKPIVATTSTFTTAANAGVNVFPNPATGMVNIQSAELAGGIARLTLTDVTGRTALSATIEMDAKGNTRADLSGIAPGVYIIRLTAAHTSYTGKLMID